MTVKKRGYKVEMILVIGMIAALSAGIWLAVEPLVEKRKAMEIQGELLQSIVDENGTIEVEADPPDGELDVYFIGETEEIQVMLLEESIAADEYVTTDEYTSMDNATADVQNADDSALTIDGIGILRIGKVDLTMPVVEGVTIQDLKYAVGHVPQTPDIGMEGNAVIAGHRSYTYGQFFNRLDEVEIGDIIRFEPRLEDEIQFEVSEILEVLPGDQQAFTQPKGEQMITLLTCTPVSKATHRLLIRAKRIT